MFNTVQGFIKNLMFNSRILSFSIFPYQDGVHVIIQGFISWYGDAWSNIGKQIECAAKSKVKRDVAFSNCKA
jgi:hypothetical protein